MKRTKYCGVVGMAAAALSFCPLAFAQPAADPGGEEKEPAKSQPAEDPKKQPETAAPKKKPSVGGVVKDAAGTVVKSKTGKVGKAAGEVKRLMRRPKSGKAAKTRAAGMTPAQQLTQAAEQETPKPATTGQTGTGTGTTGSGSGTTGSGSSSSSSGGGNTNTGENNQNNSQNAENLNSTGNQIFLGLVNVNLSNINVNVYKLIDIHNVLNNSQIDLLTQKIIDSPGATASMNVLTDLLRDARILTDTQVVVGILSKQREILFRDLKGQTP